MKRLLAFIALLLVPAPALAAQGQPGYQDPQRVVVNSLTTTCSGGGGCASTSVTQMSLASGNSVCGAAVSGTFSATLQFEQSQDGTNWFGAYLTPNSGSSAVNSTTSSFFGTMTAKGAPWFRVRMSAYTSGTAVASIYCSPINEVPNAG